MDIGATYEMWKQNPTPETMAGVVNELKPMINSEIQRFPGPKHVLRSKAKLLAVDAVKSYDPSSGAKLTSWLVTQLQPLSRYGRELDRPVYTPEIAVRQSAEVETVRQRLSDELGAEPSDDQLADATGLSSLRIAKVRTMSPAYFAAGKETQNAAGDVQDATSLGVDEQQSDSVMDLATQAVYASLDDRDKMIYDLKTGRHGHPQVDNKTIAKRLGVSEGLISQKSLKIAKMIQDNYGKV